MNHLAKVFAIKIVATVTVWCAPLILLPTSLLEAAGLPRQDITLFVRLLGWAYLALCVGYAFGLRSALQGKRALGTIWMGIVSNAGASAFLFYFGVAGAWSAWGSPLQLLAWASALAALLIAVGLFVFGAMGRGEAI